MSLSTAKTWMPPTVFITLPSLKVTVTRQMGASPPAAWRSSRISYSLRAVGGAPSAGWSAGLAAEGVFWPCAGAACPRAPFFLPGFRYEGPQGPDQRADVLAVGQALGTRSEHRLDDVHAREEGIDDIPGYRDGPGTYRVEEVLDRVGEAGKLRHLDGGGPALQRVGRAEYLVDRVVVPGIVLYRQDVLLEDIHLGLGLGKEILEELLVVRVKVVAHIHPQ